MKKQSIWFCLVVMGMIGAGAGLSQAATYVCDPKTGSPQGDGSAAHPWRTLEEALADGRVTQTGSDGRNTCPRATVKSGDTVLLRSGWHGMLRIRSGYNAQTITVAAEAGQTPQIGCIAVGDGCNWTFRGLTVSPSLAPAPLDKPPHVLVSLGEHGGTGCSNLVVETCYLFTVRDTSAWSARDWMEKPGTGISLGRGGRGHIARNNYVMNMRFGINLCAPDCVAEGNVVDAFSGDGMRVTRDGQIARMNVIKNIYVSAKDGDDNHDDGIQCFPFNKTKSGVHAVTLEDNLIIACENDALPWRAGMQGIGFFDGPLVQFKICGNVVLNNTWHGLSLYDAQQCVVSNNVVYSRWTNPEQPWIMLGTKLKAAHGNTVCDNRARLCNLKADAEVKAERNGPIREAEFLKREAELLAKINARFGALHPVAERPRLERTAAK